MTTLRTLAAGALLAARIGLYWLALMLRGAALGCDALSERLDGLRQRVRARP